MKGGFDMIKLTDEEALKTYGGYLPVYGFSLSVRLLMRLIRRFISIF